MCEPVINYYFILLHRKHTVHLLPIIQTLPRPCSLMWPPCCCSITLARDEIPPLCPLPSHLASKQGDVFTAGAAYLCVLKPRVCTLCLKTLLACVCLGPRGDVCGGCRPWIQLCLSEKYLAVTEGKPEPQEGQQGPREPANRKLTPTLVHLPNIHSLEISVLLMFFHGNVSFFKLLAREMLCWACTLSLSASLTLMLSGSNHKTIELSVLFENIKVHLIYHL